MDIVSRLKIFLEKRQISNSVFADNCKIARPTLSQLLTGRNKKVSDEIVAKIHDAYPSLSIMWLLFGEGEMEVENAKPDENSIFGNGADSASEFGETENSLFGSQNQKVIDFDDENGGSVEMPSRGLPVSPISEAMQILANGGAGNKGGVPVSSPNAGSEKKIVSIMVFYSDNSFDTFSPSQG